MRANLKTLPVLVLVVCLIVVWRALSGGDVAGAQARKAVTITRFFTGPEGLAHAEDIEL